MADLYITEFGGQGQEIDRLKIPAAAVPPLAEQKLTGVTSSEQSSAFNADTRLVMVMADGGILHVAFGLSPTATAASMKLRDGSERYFSPKPGDKVAAYDGTT